jgi:uncharacterized protein (TIGR03546 family)
MFNLVFKALKILNSDISPNQLAAGFVLGMVLGLTPLFNLHNLLVVFLICIFRVNIAAVLLSFAVFSLFAYIFDPLFSSTGLSLLQNNSLLAIWQSLYASDLAKLAKFNNTLVLGSVFYAVIISLPLFFISKILIIKYRERVLAWVAKSRIMQALKASKWYQRAERVHNMVGDA